MDNLPDRGKGRAKAWLLAHVAYAGDDCLQWPMSRDTHGYGQLGMAGGRVRKAHRVMCEMAHGEPPSPKHEAAHSCGNGHLGCINPKHLLWKTRSENQLDRRRHGSQLGHPYGNKGKLSEIERLRAALRKIIEMNVQYARDRFGDESQAEYMACVRVAREALNEQIAEEK